MDSSIDISALESRQGRSTGKMALALSPLSYHGYPFLGRKTEQGDSHHQLMLQHICYVTEFSRNSSEL